MLSVACGKKPEELIGDLKTENKIQRQWSFNSTAAPTYLGETTDKVYIAAGALSKYEAGYYLLTVHIKPHFGAVQAISYEVKVSPEDSIQDLSVNVSNGSDQKLLHFHLETSGGDPTLYAESDFDGIDNNGDQASFQFQNVNQ